MVSSVLWHWHNKQSGGGAQWDGGFHNGTDQFQVPSGHSIQRVIGWWGASGTAVSFTNGAQFSPLGLDVFTSISVIGEPNGPRLIYDDRGTIWPAYVQNPIQGQNGYFFAAYSGFSKHFDIVCRVKNPNVNGQPVDLVYSWGMGVPQGGVGVNNAIGPNWETTLSWIVLTTTPKA